MPTENKLSIHDLRKLWKEEFLPSIKQEIKAEIFALKSSIDALTQGCDALEKSQDFISKKYESVIETIQKSNSQAIKLDKEYKEVTDSLKQKHIDLVGTTNKLEDTLYQIECSLDETQQYPRRDCLEITGVTIKPDDKPKQIVKEIGSLIGVEIEDSDIVAAHKLPDSKKVKNRMIVKFLQRQKREEVYKRRGNLAGKNTSHLPSQSVAETSAGNSKTFINESLTTYHKSLLG